ncbi:MAG TPA: hypothetical protein PLZ64_02025 [Chitinophagales bacterium]|nr:hypothetical protein [Chitinophagales bacterium]
MNFKSLLFAAPGASKSIGDISAIAHIGKKNKIHAMFIINAVVFI